MIRAFFVEFVFPLLLFLFVRALFRNFLQTLRPGSQRASARQTPEVPTGGELKKDPVCGTYVSTATGITRTVHGQVLYFCSQECREKYLVG
jgi:uncharacterized protein